MMTFLKILLAVAIVIIGIIAAGIWWLRSRLSAAACEFGEAFKLVEHVDLAPARLHLVRDEHPDHEHDVESLIASLEALGFQRIGDLCDYECGLTLRISRHVSLPIAAAVGAAPNSPPGFVLFALDDTRRVVGRGNGLGDSIALDRLDWQVDPGISPESAFKSMEAALGDNQAPIDLRVIRAILEQVHGVRMDRKIVHQPTRDTLGEIAAAKGLELTDEQFDTALGVVMEHWYGQINDAVLDRYRRNSRIDAASWEALRDDIHVVHARLDNDSIEAMLVFDEAGQKVFGSCVAQGLSGIDLYRAVTERLPPDQQWVELDEVERPVRAVLFKPDDSIASNEPAAGHYLYEAADPDGKVREGSVIATSSGDAKQQLSRMGMRNPRIITEPVPGSNAADELCVDDTSARVAAKAATQSVGLSTVRALGGNWWIWAPPLALLAKSLHDGAPFSWGDYAVFAYALLALMALTFLIAPIILYNQLLLATLKAETRPAMLLVRALGALSIFGGMTAAQLRAERCKILAMDGKCDQALSLWKDERGNMSEAEYLAGLVSIFDASGDVQQKIETQRLLLDTPSSRETAVVDLAMSLARYTDDIDDPEKLIQSVSPAELSELAVAGYQYTRGLLAARRGQYALAIRHYTQALETAEQYAAMPIVLGFIAEMNGYVALALKQSGDEQKAGAIWDSVLPILTRHRSTASLIEAYEAA